MSGTEESSYQLVSNSTTKAFMYKYVLIFGHYSCEKKISLRDAGYWFVGPEIRQNYEARLRASVTGSLQNQKLMESSIPPRSKIWEFRWDDIAYDWEQDSSLKVQIIGKKAEVLSSNEKQGGIECIELD